MPNDKPKVDQEQVAAHPDESNRDHGKAEPGAGLERRQERNAQRTEEAQGGKPHPTAPGKPDPMNP